MTHPAARSIHANHAMSESVKRGGGPDEFPEDIETTNLKFVAGNPSVIAAAGRISNYLRRSSGRIIDVHWLLQNRRYALHVIDLADRADDPVIRAYAQVLWSALAPSSADAPRVAE